MIGELFTNYPVLTVIVLIWTLPWTGYALWKSARRGDNIWFVLLFLLNTLAILEILYIFVFSEMKFKKKKNVRTRARKK